MNIKNKFLVLTISLVGALSLAGCGKSEEKGPKPEGPKPEAKTTVGTEVDDAAITTKVKSALLADPDVKSLDIKVETRKGEVQLSGFVDNQGQIDRAIAVAKGVEGVKKVDNKMSLKTTSTSVGEKIDDAVITTKVKAALLADPGVKSSDIAVVTRDGEVQLSGFVDSQSQIDRATEVAKGVEGVKSVINEMSVKK
ncbi:BON domain-containing protein [Nitrosovibrio tenuis]|uniref:Osmotically-inducible protein Y n=1 Tax=Nitrosovibrio tenuis TaxID=1233 RepID=A0A1H7I570_9PROT|nr:BON domain-containing protein [Nitrosovibrio tenuis]SEK57656.1 hyperosmotically inducible protein [Nitrosovibrio tenuis]